MKKQVSACPMGLPTSLKAVVAGIAGINEPDGFRIDGFVAVVAELDFAMKTVEFFTERRSRLTSEQRTACCAEREGQSPDSEDTV
ncbi:MAG: hypothetical protein OXI92_11165 [Acidobacteriota bacterium]|nr:hypothetical protein [Acidobacteriota bacterium]